MTTASKPPETHEDRQRAALRHVFVSFGKDLEPIRMVEAILRGERDDVVRSLGRKAAA